MVSKSRILPGAGFVHHRDLPRGPNGRALCRYCGNEVPTGRKTFCGGQKAAFAYRTGLYIEEGHGCVHEHCVRSQPGYARKCVWARDQGKCALCSTRATRNAGWQADHIVPVVEGGGACDLQNLRTLCTSCHNQETAALAARRAEARKAGVGTTTMTSTTPDDDGVNYDFLPAHVEPLAPTQKEWLTSKARLCCFPEENPEPTLRALWNQGPHYTGRKVWAAEYAGRQYFFFGAKSEIEHLIRFAKEQPAGPLAKPAGFHTWKACPDPESCPNEYHRANRPDARWETP